MRRNQDQFEPSHESDRSSSSRDRDADDVDDDDEDDEDTQVGVSKLRNRVPPREAEEEEIADDDIMEQLDEDDSARGEGPDA